MIEAKNSKGGKKDIIDEPGIPQITNSEEFKQFAKEHSTDLSTWKKKLETSEKEAAKKGY